MAFDVVALIGVGAAIVGQTILGGWKLGRMSSTLEEVHKQLEKQNGRLYRAEHSIHEIEVKCAGRHGHETTG